MTSHTENSFSGTVRVAVYLRYSSDGQNPTSLEDQLRNCEDCAKSKNWTILSNYIRSDAGISGAALRTRKDVLSLLEDAKRQPRPFDGLVMDHTSRLGRDVPDVVKVSDIFNRHGVFLYFATQRLDSRDPSYRTLLIMNAMRDEEYRHTLGANVHRGMKGKALKGYHTGGHRYGYTRLLVDDPCRKDEHGRAAVAYSLLKKDPYTAPIVLSMYQARKAGVTLSDIARQLNAKGVKAPHGTWTYTSVRDILRSELYKGIKKWNTTTTGVDPETGKKYVKERPQSEWVIVTVPELQIVSDELWEAVQEIDRKMRRPGRRQQLGRLHRTQASRTYLFSSIVKCGICSDPLNIVRNDYKGARYGCRGHFYGKVCSNGLTIHHDRLEEQLLEAMLEKLRPNVLDDGITKYRQKIEEVLKEAGTADQGAKLRNRIGELQRKQRNLITAIASYEDSSGLIPELRAVEAEMKSLTHQLAELAEFDGPKSFEQFRDFVHQKAGELKCVLTGDRLMAKQVLGRLIGELFLTPVETKDGPAFMVTGDINVFAPDSSVMLSDPAEHSAKHYAFPLTLTGLQLDPRRAASVRDSSSANDATILAACTETPALNATNV